MGLIKGLEADSNLTGFAVVGIIVCAIATYFAARELYKESKKEDGIIDGFEG